MKTKGFVFTIDAIFSLIVAAAAVGILIYAHFSEPASFQVTSAEALSTAQALIQMPLSASTSLVAQAATSSGEATGPWPYYAQGYGLASSAAYGPLMPQLLFQYTAAGSITSTPSVANGKVVFASGSTIYLINASTGNVENPYPITISGSVIYPIFYRTNIIYENSTGYMTERNDAGNVIWSSADPVPTTPVAIEDNYIAYGSGDNVYLINPTNGTQTASFTLAAVAKLPAYSSGEFFASTSQPGSSNYLYGLTFYGGALHQTWTYSLKKWNTTNPAVYDGVVSVGTGDQIYGLSLGGSLLWSTSAALNVTAGGAAADNGYYFYSTARNILEVNLSTGSTENVFNIPYTSYNETPSVTSQGVYVFANKTQFMAFPYSGGSSPSWDSYVLSQSTLPYQNIALAYGNAYVSGGDTLYAFGTCRGNPQESLLQAIAGMYIDGNGGCAALLLNASYNSKSATILINGTYAPSISVANFNGVNSIIATNTSKKYPMSSITITGWFYVSAFNSGNGVQEWWTDISESPTIGLQSYPNTYPGYTSTGFTLWIHNATDSTSGCGTGNIQINKWYFVVARINDTNANMTVNNGEYNCNFNFVNDGGAVSMPDIGTYCPTCVGAGSVMYGKEEDIQMYDTVISPSMIQTLYSEGIGGLPLANLSDVLVGWWPLNGNANDYSGNGNIGYPYSITYGSTNFTPQSLSSAYDVGAYSFPLPLAGLKGLYNVSVVVWK
jgi:hypothetical protein